MKVVKGYFDFIKEDLNNEEEIETTGHHFDEESNDDLILSDSEEEEEYSDDQEKEGNEYIGDTAMAKLAEALDIKPTGNFISFEGNKIEYASEIDGFLIKGRVGNKKVPIKDNNIEEAIEQVLDLVGAGVLTEKKWIKTDPKERGKYAGKGIVDLEKSKTKLLTKDAKTKKSGTKVSKEDREKMSELNFALRAKRGHGFKKR